MATIVVAVSPHVASELAHPQGGLGAEATGLLAHAAGLGVTLRPQHPGVDDPGLARWFVVDGVPDADADHVAAEIRRQPAVEGAYAQPAAEAP